MIELLNGGLADAIHLALLAKQAHWNVKGPTFLQLHELFDQFRDEADEWSDLVAERAVQLGGAAEGTLETVSDRTGLRGFGVGLSGGAELVLALSEALAAFGKSTRAAIDKAMELGDAATADIFTEMTRGADKMLWFLEAHLQQ